MRSSLLAAALVVTTSLLCGPSLLWGGVADPHLRSSGSVDARSAKTIVADLSTPSQTDEQKVIAVFNWLRRVMYHSGPEEPRVHDFPLVINVFGYGSCYIQTHPLSHLLKEAGYESRNWVHLGHHMLEVQYGGAWHCLDPHMTFYAYNRATPPVLASIEELRKDDTLAGDAVKEKRACPGYLLCGDKPKFFSGNEKWVNEGAFPPIRNGDKEFGAIALPRGTKYVRTWRTGKFFQGHAFGKGAGPYHTCGAGADRKDAVNFPYWEPYKEGSGVRHYGTGFLDYHPDLRGDGWKEGTVKAEKVQTRKEGIALGPAEPGAEGEVIFFVSCPYIIAAAAMDLSGALGGTGDRLTVCASKDKPEADKWKEVLAETDAGAVKKTVDLTKAVEGAVGGYWVRVVMQAKDPAKTGLDDLKIHSDFQLNPYVLPQLLPGFNKLTVTAAKADRPWNFRLSWSEGENWGTAKEYKATLNGTRHEAAVEAAGPKFPRMETLEFSVDP